MDVIPSSGADGSGGAADAAVAGESAEGMRPHRRVSAGVASIWLLVAGLAAMIGVLLVRCASVFNEMSANANLVIPGEFAVMGDGEFVRSLLPAAGAAGIVHLVGVIAGLVGRTRAEARAEHVRCALGVGANAFFLACASMMPFVGSLWKHRSLVLLLVACGAAVLTAWVVLFRHLLASAGAISVGAGATGLLLMAGAMLVGLFAMLHELATTPGRPFLPGLVLLAVSIGMSVPAGLIQAVGLIVGVRGHSRAGSEAERVRCGRGIVLNLPFCWCIALLPIALAS